MSFTTYEVKNHVGIIRYNNPPLNILTWVGLADIKESLTKAAEDPTVYVVLFTMEQHKKVFCAGMDLDEMLAFEDTRQYCEESKAVYVLFESISKPTVYVYDGVVRGGAFEMSLFADFRFAGEKINIALPEITLGILPGGGSTQKLPQLVGEAKAKEIILTGKVLRAEEVEKLNIVTEVVSSDDLLDRAMTFAEKLAAFSPHALQSTKRAIQEGRYATIEQGLKIETNHFVDNFHTKDAAEGITAFREKREPNFKNN